jgi:hypothetical protein
MKKLLLVLLFFPVLFACKSNNIKHVEKAFYYWKSYPSSLSTEEDSLLKSTHVTKMYVKYFEVENHPVMGTIPTTKTQFYYYPDSTNAVKIVPTVFIRNEVFKKTTHADLDKLADNVNFLLNKYSGRQYNNLATEYQMDCDWTKSTKDNYFYFLKALKTISKKDISCTLRLYPYKYPEVMGVPPVDRATLMCYNLVNPIENKNTNSILDKRELKSYLDAKKYPLHLDVALPVYSWMQVYQNGKFARVINDIPNGFLSTLKSIKPLWYEATADIVVDDIFIRKGDRIKVEAVSAGELEEAIDIIKSEVDFDESITVTLFHLDGQQLSNYKHEEINRFYSDFLQ